MKIQADQHGFLVGDPVDLGRMPKYLLDIKGDVAAIKRAVVSPSDRTKQPLASAPVLNKPKTTVAVPVAAKKSAYPAKAANDVNGASKAGVENLIERLRPAPNKTAAVPGKRDASGKFTSNGEGTGLRDVSAGAVAKLTHRLSALADGSGIEGVDPTVKAFREVAEPMQRGIELFSGGDKKGHWNKKIFKSLESFRKDESVFNKAASKTLKNIEEKPSVSSGDGGSGVLSMMAGLLGNKVAGAGVGLLGMAGSAGKGLMGMGKGLGKGLLKKVPVLGLLLGGIGAASDIFGNENDGGLSRGEKDRRDGKSVGGLAGSMGGMMAGAKLGAMAGALGGPIGAAIGGFIGGAVGMFFGDQAGQIIGEKTGEWVNELREADIPGKLMVAWDGALKLFSDAWTGLKSAGEKGLDWVADKASAANDFIKEKTGVDVGQAVKDIHQNLVDYTADTVIPSLVDLKNKGVDAASKGAEWVGDNTTVGKGVGYIKSLLQTEGKTRVYEKDDGSKETREGGTVSWRNNNPGNLKFEYAGSADKTVKSKRTKEQALLSAQKAYDGVVDLDQWGNAIFSTEDAGRNAKAKLLTKKHGDKTIEEMLPQYAISDYSGKADTQAYASGIHALASSRGLDLKGKKIADLNPDEFNALMDGMKKVEGFKEGRVSVENSSPAPTEIAATPSISGDPTQGGRYKFETLDGGQVQVTDNETMVTELASDEQANAYRKQQGKPYLDKVAAINAGDMQLYNRLSAGAGNVASQTVSAPVPSPPVMPTSPKIADAPPVIEPLSTPDQRPLTVNIANQDVGQDLSDRKIAHIVTGGLSG